VNKASFFDYDHAGYTESSLMFDLALTPPFMAEICRRIKTGFSHNFPWFRAKATIGFVLSPQAKA